MKFFSFIFSILLLALLITNSQASTTNTNSNSTTTNSEELSSFSSSSSNSYDNLHLMNHREAEMILNLLNSLRKYIQSNIDKRESDLSSRRETLYEKRSNYTQEKAQIQSEINSAETQKDIAQGELDVVREELQALSEREDEFEINKWKTQKQIDLIDRIKRLITGDQGILGDSCASHDCHEGLICETESEVCKRKEGDMCVTHDDCLSGSACVEKTIDDTTITVCKPVE